MTAGHAERDGAGRSHDLPTRGGRGWAARPDVRGGAMQALQLTEWQHDPELREVDPPEPGPGEVLVRVAAAGRATPTSTSSTTSRPACCRTSCRSRSATRTPGWSRRWAPACRPRGRPARGGVRPVGLRRCLRCVEGRRTTASARPRSVRRGRAGRDGGMAPSWSCPSARYLVPLGDLDPVAAAPLTDAGLTRTTPSAARCPSSSRARRPW